MRIEYSLAMEFEWDALKAVSNEHKQQHEWRLETMRKEYDLKKLKVKRRGLLPGLEASAEKPAKVRITISLDGDLIEHFKAEATKPGGLPYQTQINQTLRQALALDRPGDTEAMKNALLEDPDFLEALAEKLRAA